MTEPEEELYSELKKYFRYSFQSNVRPVWLVNPKTGRRLEIDFYSKKGKIAIELNDIYHYHPRVQKNLDYKRYLDWIKKEQIEARGIRFLAIPMIMLTKKKVFNYLWQSGLFRVKDGYLV